MNLVHTEFTQAGYDEGGGVLAGEGKFRVPVQVAAPGRHVFRIIGVSVQNGHCELRCGVQGTSLT